jgi:predicted molibdopterin-dependent oxidoreductase YjgC
MERSATGECTAGRAQSSRRARHDRAVPGGMVFIPFAFVEPAANILTNPQLDPFGEIPEHKFCAARVDKLERADPGSGIIANFNFRPLSRKLLDELVGSGPIGNIGNVAD